MHIILFTNDENNYQLIKDIIIELVENNYETFLNFFGEIIEV